MPVVEQATLQSVAAKQRPKLRRLLDERSVLQYSFSFRKLMAGLEGLGLDPETARDFMKDCVVAADEESCKSVKKDLNDQISEILSENGLTGVRDQDPLGRKVDCLTYMSKTARQFKKDKAIEAAPSLGISTKKAIELIEAGMEDGKPYAVVTIREVKEEKEK